MTVVEHQISVSVAIVYMAIRRYNIVSHILIIASLPITVLHVAMASVKHMKHVHHRIAVKAVRVLMTVAASIARQIANYRQTHQVRVDRAVVRCFRKTNTTAKQAMSANMIKSRLLGYHRS